MYKLLKALLTSIALMVIMITTCIVHEASAGPTQDFYSCTRPPVRCDPQTNNFHSTVTTGSTQAVHTVNVSKFNPAEGVFGDALVINGYKQQYFTVPNKPEINPEVFSVSFWMKQDPLYLGNSAIVSHTNEKKTAGWYFQFNVTKQQRYIQFSVANTQGKIFNVSSPFDTGVFQNLVGTFDGEQLKIYLNGNLVNGTQFHGNYNSDPEVPLNVGLNSYNRGASWTGQIDELRIYNTAISEKDVNRLSDYGSYIQLSQSSSGLNGLVAYWPFDGETEDKSANLNDGSLIFPVVSMVFSPDGRLFFSIRDAGEIRIITEAGRILDSPFVRFEDSNNTITYLETHGIALDPQFAENHYVYVYATVKDIVGNIFNRVVRFTEVENKGTNQIILLDNIPKGGGLEYAGALGFGPDDKLYVTTDYSKQQQQDKATSSPLLSGKVLRLNRDGTIPSDNPIPNSTIYNTGHRNMFGIAFDSTTGIGIVAENDATKYDEINVLKDGKDYGYPLLQKTASSPSSSVATLVGTSQTDNSSAMKPARTYYKVITPTQAIFYDGKKFPLLKGKFLFASYGEKTLYAISLNNTGRIIEELAIRLPELLGPIISIAKSPNGEIYLGGEKIYKLNSIDSNNIVPLTYFIDLSGNDLRIDNVLVNLTAKVLAINFTSENNMTVDMKNVTNTNNITLSPSSPSLQVRIPKALLGTIYQVTSEKFNTSLSDENPIQDYNTKQTRRVTNVGDTIVDIQLRSDISSDKILIKGQSSSLVKSAPRNIIR